jgi:GNAT superfamily N-acetyltransferase
VLSIRPAVTPADLDLARALFREYERAVDAPVCFEGFERELAELERRYSAPEGRLLLAFDGSEAVGCGAFRRFPDGAAEGRRLYLRASQRGKGLGRALVRALLDEARLAGARAFRLETLPGKMSAALAMYRKLGFVDAAPWIAHPIAGAAYLELPLAALDR